MRTLLCHERFLFRFGADRALILLGKGLAGRGHTVSIMANRYDRPIVEQFAACIVDVPEPPGRYYYLNEDTVEWLRTSWESLFDDRTRPDVVIVGGWPFFAAIPFFRSVCPEVVYVDFGAVPTEGYEGGALLTQQKLRQLRAEFLPQASRIVAISDFIRDSQSVVDSGGAVPTQTILLGADHVEHGLWASGQVQGGKAGQALAIVAGLKAAGRKVILSLGRWEPGCYKNSEEALGLLRAIREQVSSAILAILAPAGVEIPSDLQDAVHPLGFPDDAELAEVMRQCDLGVSLSRWEGFNLPLAEMQWLDRPALAFDLAAHPEVILHPWFLCGDFAEMVGKSVAILSGRGLSGEIQAQASERFHQRFRWSRMVQEYEQLIAGRPGSGVRLVIDVSNSTRDPANSGVVRVTRRFGRTLQCCEDPLFVVWQGDANRYVLPTREEFAQLGQFNGPLLTGEERLSPSGSERVDLEQALERFGRRDPWIIFGETMMEARFQHIRRYVRKLDLRAAAIFYDAIPVLRPDLCNEEARANHRGYMTGLAECDVVVPISRYSAQCLRDFWDAQGIAGCAIHADVLPGEFGGSGRMTAPPSDSDVVRILCVSTLEPRKNHRRLVEACVSLKQSHPHLRWKLTLVGNKYQGAFEIADWIQEVSREHPEVQWLGIVDDDTLRRLYGEAAFTVYPSVMEGFGLPIVESIWHGRPCICSRDGVMGELAREGGCLTADVEDVRALAEAIATLAEDRQLRHRLFDQAVARKLKTWDSYGEEFMGVLSASPPPVRPAAPPQNVQAQDRPVPWTDLLYPSCILDRWQMHDGERLALLALLARHKPHCSVEIGTFHGGSLSLIAQFSDMVFSIDIDPDVADRVRPMPNVTLLTGDSAEVLPVLFRELTAARIAVDFILIDGDHSQDGLKRDIALVLQYVPVKPLFVVMHDCLNPGCRQAMLESAWHDSPYCHWVELDLVPGRPVDNDEPAKGELWGGLAVAYFQPSPRKGPLTVNRTAESLFRTLAADFQAKRSRVPTSKSPEGGSMQEPYVQPPDGPIPFEECYWYTTMDLPGHGVIPGEWDLGDFDQYIGNFDVAGRTLLDVGSASGYLSFEAERRGARVISFDMVSVTQRFHLPFASNLYFQDRDEWDRQKECGLERLKNSYWYAHRHFKSRNKVVYGDIFRLDRALPGPVEVTIAGAIMEHMNDQISVIGSIARVTEKTIIIAFTPIIDTDELIARPLLPLTNPRDDITWWNYSRGLYERVLRNVGFAIVDIRPSRAHHCPSGQNVQRSTLIATRIAQA